MCRTLHAVLQTAICGIQMLVRVFMTIILMIENLIRMILQTLYNFVSFVLQMLSLIPICVVFLLTARLKCFMCGGGGPCPVNRGGACDCVMSGLAIIILFFIFRATGVLDKIFYSLGYAKARAPTYRFVPTPGDITECSRNDSDYTDESTTLNDANRFTDYVTDYVPSSTYLETSTAKLDDTVTEKVTSELITEKVSPTDSKLDDTTEIVKTETESGGGRRLFDILRNKKKIANLMSYNMY
ncbi:uncharacterized protein LOC123654497 [Melitaea cinxia]|uniref:uncharacterized protein LOC123654497 n=1 Tax=Melitaea cinxia TaxID=113334 RepID=UPI001E272A6D|nr:uncharacterized protein LOC123654497 [Melitaea cinxia]